MSHDTGIVIAYVYGLEQILVSDTSFFCCIISEGKPRESYPRYSGPQRVREFEQRENNNNEFYNVKRDTDYYPPERSFHSEEQSRKDMRGDEHRGRDYSYDRGREVPQYITEKHGNSNGRNFVENDTGSERNHRKSVGDASVSFNVINCHIFFKRLLHSTAADISLGFQNCLILFIGMRKIMCFWSISD